MKRNFIHRYAVMVIAICCLAVVSAGQASGGQKAKTLPGGTSTGYTPVTSRGPRQRHKKVRTRNHRSHHWTQFGGGTGYIPVTGVVGGNTAHALLPLDHSGKQHEENYYEYEVLANAKTLTNELDFNGHSLKNTPEVTLYAVGDPNTVPVQMPVCGYEVVPITSATQSGNQYVWTAQVPSDWSVGNYYWIVAFVPTSEDIAGNKSKGVAASAHFYRYHVVSQYSVPLLKPVKHPKHHRRHHHKPKGK